jgi:hypothetical protein
LAHVELHVHPGGERPADDEAEALTVGAVLAKESVEFRASSHRFFATNYTNLHEFFESVTIT